MLAGGHCLHNEVCAHQVYQPVKDDLLDIYRKADSSFCSILIAVKVVASALKSLSIIIVHPCYN